MALLNRASGIVLCLGEQPDAVPHLAKNELCRIVAIQKSRRISRLAFSDENRDHRLAYQG
jgi:hypothetical protein